MTSVIVPPVDLAPGMPSRVVTISATDVTEGGRSLEGQMLRFALSDTLDVTSGGDVIAKTQAEVVLDEAGNGRIRLPVYDASVKTWCGQDWAILVTTTWGSQKAIRVPAGTSSIALSALPPVRPLRGREKQWAVTGASVTVTEGGNAGGSVSLSGGVLDFRLTIPRGDWNRGGITSGGDVDTLYGGAAAGHYRIDSLSVAGMPYSALGVLEVWYNSASGITVQTFTETSRTMVRQSVRVRQAGAWTPWRAFSWNQGLVLKGTDLDTISSPGAYAIQFLDHANQPAQSVGALEVLAVGGTVLQRFTTYDEPPRVHTRRLTAQGWGAWSTPTGGASAALESRVSAVELKTLSLPAARAPLSAQDATVTPVDSSRVVGALSHDRVLAWNTMGSVLRVSTDSGQTWRDVITFTGRSMEAVVPLDTGELLITGNDGASGLRKVWVTDGILGPDPTWTDVMTARVGGIKFTSSWSISAHGSIILVNEYGPKAGATWPGYGDGGPVQEGDNARYTYLSLDYGKTWKTIFDLNTYLRDDRGLDKTSGQHLHGVLWDPYWDRIWVTFGDETDGVVYSDDLGATWGTAVWSSVASSATQAVGMVAMPQCVLFGSDNFVPTTVYRINRSEGKNRQGVYTLDSAWEWEGEGRHLLQGRERIARNGDDAPALFAFCAEGASAPSVLVGTLDGYAFTELWVDDEVASAGMGLRTVVGPTLDGQFIASSNWNGGPGVWKQIAMRATGY